MVQVLPGLITNNYGATYVQHSSQLVFSNPIILGGIKRYFAVRIIRPKSITSTQM
jgi:hypothetical protein